MTDIIADTTPKGYGHNVWAAGNYYFWVSKPIRSEQTLPPSPQYPLLF